MLITKIIKPKFKIPNFTDKSILSVDCGEQILPVGGACLLGSINLTQFVDSENKNWDYDLLDEYIPYIVRFMDNVNDITYVPLDSQKEEIKAKRRIGLGVMGYGSALYMLKLKYGSDAALKMTDELMDFISNKSYQASSLLANEKGKFKSYSPEYLNSNFIKTLWPETIKLIEEHGTRNSHLMSIQPTGNTSVVVNCVSGGFEPVFMPEYVRTSTQPYAPAGLIIPKNIDWENKKFEMDGATNQSIWMWIKEGDESLLRTEFDGVVYKIDKSRGLVKETSVVDYGVMQLKLNNEWDKTAEYAATTETLSIAEHIDTMKVFSKHICSAMSKTINLPHDYPFDEFKNVYMQAYETGTIKGVTTYRAGTMATVLSDKKTETFTTQTSDNRNGHIRSSHAPHRPKQVPCDVHQLKVGDEKWTVFVGLIHNEFEVLVPYEVFAFKKKNITLSTKISKGTLTKVKRGRYDFETIDGTVIEDIASLFDTDEQQSVTRMISLSLRHGADIKYIVEQLSKASGNFIDFSKAISRVLKKYVKDGEISTETCIECGTRLIYSEGCKKCVNCGYSACS